jgi:hypothetical protein
MYKAMSLLSTRLAAVSFVAASAICMRWVLLNHLLTIFRMLPPVRDETAPTFLSNRGATSCRFTVDLKGVLRFLSNEKEAKVQKGNPGGEILVSHIVVRALAKAISQLPHLAARKYPFLPGLFSVDVCVHERKTKSSVWVTNADEKSVQDIADLFKGNQPLPSFLQSAMGPTCHLFTSPDSDHSQVDLDLTLRDVPIAVCVSGIRLEKETKTPCLSLSINIQSTDVDECRTFSERMQQFIRKSFIFPCQNFRFIFYCLSVSSKTLFHF